MGKNKAQRTKNNAQPSSSSRSAELLGASVPNFVGFSAARNGGYVPVMPGLSISAVNEVDFNTIDLAFQTVFRKIQKKDPTTKVKALQEFGTLCKESRQSSVEAILSIWPRHYGVLSIDNEHRVREAAQLSHAALVKRVGRNIATYLKQLAGPWFTSQYDTYAPAASAATNSFHSTFSKKKISDVIVYCQDEILKYMSENILLTKLESLNTTIMLTTEELECKYQRIVIACLQGYATYLKQIPKQQIDKTLNIHQEIISSKEFWKLSKHESSSIKSGLFNVLTSLIINHPELIKDEKKRTITTIMNSLDETEPGLVSAVWECALVVIDNNDDWHTYVSIEKLVIPKLFKVLKNGGQGCATVIYPNVLPFISQFPKFNINDKGALYLNFFDNMAHGFNSQAAVISKSEISAIMKSFFECLRYVILLNNSDIELCESIIEMILLDLIEYCMRRCCCQRGLFFHELNQLLRYWSKHRDQYDYLLRLFWANIKSTFGRVRAYNSTDSEDIDTNQDGEIEFLLALQKLPTTPAKKNNHVTFADSEEETSEKSDVDTELTEFDGLFADELQNFVNQLCIEYVESINAEDEDKNMYITHFYRLISYFGCEELIRAIATVHRNDATILDFYNECLQNWLKKEPEECEAAVGIVFLILKYLSVDEKEIILNSLQQFDKDIFNEALKCGFRGHYQGDETIKKWLLKDEITQHLISVAKGIPKNRNELDAELLCLAFDSPNHGQIVITEHAVNEIIKILCNSIHNHGTIRNHVVELIASLLEYSWNHRKITDGTFILIKTLFELSIKDQVDCPDLKETVSETWISAFTQIRKKLDFETLSNFKKELIYMVYEHIYNTNKIELYEIIDDAMAVLESTDNSNYQEVLDIVLQLNFEHNDWLTEWIPEVADLIIHGEIISGNFYTKNPLKSIGLDENEITLVLPGDEKSPDKTLRCLQWAVTTTKLICQILSRTSDLDTNEINSVFSLDELNTKFAMILNSLLLIGSFGKFYQKHYQFSKNSDLILEYFHHMDDDVIDLRERTPEFIWAKVLDLNDVNRLWTGFGSIFDQYLTYLNGDDNHLNQIKSSNVEFFNSYMSDIETKKPINYQLNAVIIARILLIQDEKQYARDVLKFIKHHVKSERYNLIGTEDGVDISQMKLSDFHLCIETMRLLSQIVKIMPGKLETALWDAVMLFLSSWTISLNKSKENYQDIKVKGFVAATSDLFYDVQLVISQHRINQIDGIPPMLMDEWSDVIIEEIQKNIIEIFVYLSKVLNQKSEELTPYLMFNYLGKTLMTKLEEKYLIDFSNNTDKSNELFELALSFFTSPVVSLQLSAFYLLRNMIPRIVEHDKQLIDNETFDFNDLKLKKFEESLLNTQKIVNIMLMDFRVCDAVTCGIPVHTDAYTYTLGYLLEWMIILEICALTHTDLRYQYGELLKDDLFSSLMNNVFRMLPVEVWEENKSKMSIRHLQGIFRNAPKLECGMRLTEEKIEHMVCWIYIHCLRHLPVLARQWWGTTESRVSTAVDRITTVYASPILIEEELSNKQIYQNDMGNLHVKVQPNARTVVALYEMDDTKLELSMVLPNNHPLGLVTVEPGQHVGGAANWRNCHMQLSIFLIHQNGSVWDALLMWRKNLDKKFSGVEECYICFSIFHVNTYQIPKLSCHTCKKKFHAPCLYKWFSTSQKATCPICRNMF